MFIEANKIDSEGKRVTDKQICMRKDGRTLIYKESLQYECNTMAQDDDILR